MNVNVATRRNTLARRLLGGAPGASSTPPSSGSGQAAAPAQPPACRPARPWTRSAGATRSAFGRAKAAEARKYVDAGRDGAGGRTTRRRRERVPSRRRARARRRRAQRRPQPRRRRRPTCFSATPTPAGPLRGEERPVARGRALVGARVQGAPGRRRAHERAANAIVKAGRGPARGRSLAQAGLRARARERRLSRHPRRTSTPARASL